MTNEEYQQVRRSLFRVLDRWADKEANDLPCGWLYDGFADTITDAAMIAIRAKFEGEKSQRDNQP